MKEQNWREQWLRGHWKLDHNEYQYQLHIMNYSFNADYREVAKRMYERNRLKILIGGFPAQEFSRYIKRFLKWPWC